MMSFEGSGFPEERDRRHQKQGPCPRRGSKTVETERNRVGPGQGLDDLPSGEGEVPIFGPMPRDYSFSLPKKVKRAALRAALSLKRQEGKLILLDDFPLEGFKTRQVLEVLKRFQVEDALIVTDEKHPFLERSARNIPGIQVLRYEGLNVYDILNHEHLILLRPAVEKIQGVLAS